MRASHGREAGQGTVELVALLPLVVVVALAAAQLLAAGVARELAAHAAENGAIALADGEDAGDAVRTALPGWARGAVRVVVRGREVRVRLTPVTVFPGAGRALASEARADAGPAAGAGPGGARGPAPTALGAVSAPTRDDPGAAPAADHGDAAAAAARAGSSSRVDGEAP
ncbi:hypothetical protein NBH00_07070 [Paraconexibacter antarcticus]|uniref:TadE-like protein n=1 Tax=Paraconexibacter antarcticus TaxID=2949664 RepID=A0ABY5DVC6_9ACTN|nr:hypothetical protein [Paraconexibacter antarcticus]UTI65963.1 hypothetical protein NBH00_07070 [Paraconexibacter antarcticus]